MQTEQGSISAFALNASDWDSTQGVPPKLHLQRTAGESARSPSVMKQKSHPELASHKGGTSLKTGGWIKHIYLFRLGFWSLAMRTLIMSCAPSAFCPSQSHNEPPPYENTHSPTTAQTSLLQLTVSLIYKFSRIYKLHSGQTLS